MNKYYLLKIFAPIIGVIMFFCNIMVATGKATLEINSYAVDKQGKLYIGRDHEIIVLEDTKILRRINPKTSRAYRFTIIDGEKILLSTTTKVYTMDLFGNVLSEEDDEGTKTYNELRMKKSFYDEDGNKFTIRHPFLRTQILKNGKVIYKIPLLDYLVRICSIFAALLLLPLVVVAFKDWTKRLPRLE